MPERRFNETEVAAIIERATTEEARGQHLVHAGAGMTLAQLQDIGREVGIAPQLIADAANKLEGTGQSVTRSSVGLPLRVERVVELNRRLSDEEWERVVVDLREIFNARGVLTSHGSLRQWTNGNLQALLELTDNAQRIRLRTYKGNALGFMAAGLGVFVAATTALIVNAVTGAAVTTERLTLLALASTGGISLLGFTALRLRLWAQQRHEQMGEVAARVADLDQPWLTDSVRKVD